MPSLTTLMIFILRKKSNKKSLKLFKFGIIQLEVHGTMLAMSMEMSHE